MVSLLSFLFLLLHPHHQSVTEINYNKDESVLEISITLTGHDLEYALSKESNAPFSFSKTEDSLQHALVLSKYILERFNVKIQTETIELDYLGVENGKDETTVYFESEPIDDMTGKMEIENSVLMDYFKDQQNIIKFFNGNRKATNKLEILKPKMEIQLN